MNNKPRNWNLKAQEEITQIWGIKNIQAKISKRNESYYISTEMDYTVSELAF